MAKNETKHKSKYTAPKDMAKSQKPETRKDLKDYIKDLVKKCMWEFSEEIQPGPRKDDKWSDDKTAPYVHNHTHEGGKEHVAPDMVPDRKDVDNAYPIKMMQDGDPKMAAHAKKAFEKNIEKDAEAYMDIMNLRSGNETTKKLKESLLKLSESQKEQFVRKYIRKQISSLLRENYLMEQDAEPPTAEEPPADAPADAPADPAADPAADPGADPAADPGADPTADAGADPAADMGADLGGGAPSGGGGGGGGSSSPSPSMDVPPTTDDALASSTDPEKEAMGNKIKSSIDSLVKDVKEKLANATPLEVAPEVVQPIKDLMDDMTTAKAITFKKAIATAMRNADIKLPSEYPSDDYTENEA
mgnify:CR=1 FL=1|tara:strand:+ start:599 stop:1675 length:1077 start_codon:yes stop_codon:yes gene_type:complete